MRRNDRLLSSGRNGTSTRRFSVQESLEPSGWRNAYVAFYPADTIVAGTSLFGSSNDWDYDFQNVPELRGTDFWSEGGATGLYWTKYEMGAAAIRKIALESPDFYRRFNAEYYARINANPTVVRPTRALIVDIIQTLVPQIESRRRTGSTAEHLPRRTSTGRRSSTTSGLPVRRSLRFRTCTSWRRCRVAVSGHAGTAPVEPPLSSAGERPAAGSQEHRLVGSLQIQPTQNPSDGYFGIGPRAEPDPRPAAWPRRRRATT